MLFETLLVSGCVLAILSIASLLSALVDGRRPRIAAFAVVVSGGLIFGAASVSEDGLQIEDVPYAFVRVVGSFLK